MSDRFSLKKNLGQSVSADDPVSKSCLYYRLPVQDKNRVTAFYFADLAPGNTLGSEQCSRIQVRSIIQDWLLPDKIHLISANYPRVMVVAPPTLPWLRMARKYDPARIILCMPEMYLLNEDEEKNLQELHDMGMQVATSIYNLRNYPDSNKVVACLDYALIDDSRKEELMPVYLKLKQVRPNIKSIGISNYGETVPQSMAANYDLVRGRVGSDLLPFTYQNRPEWQHNQLRAFAELFSGIYDIKDIGGYSVLYPVIGHCMKGLLSSKELRVIQQQFWGGEQSGSERLAKNYMREYMSIAIGFSLYYMGEKLLLEKKTGKKQPDFTPSRMDLEPMVISLCLGKMVEALSKKPCDDYSIRQSFMTGFLSKSYLFLHCRSEDLADEFPLNAASSYFSSEITSLGKVISLCKAFSTKNFEAFNLINSGSDFSYTKEQIYEVYLQSLMWAEAVLRAIGVRSVLAA